MTDDSIAASPPYATLGRSVFRSSSSSFIA